MRTLKFIVDKQIIEQDPSCDFTNLVPGTEGYLEAEFTFSKEWNGTTKIVGFYSMMGTEYPARILKNGKTCVIPAEALKRHTFKMQVFGRKGDMTLTTNRLIINQDGGINESGR